MATFLPSHIAVRVVVSDIFLMFTGLIHPKPSQSLSANSNAPPPPTEYNPRMTAESLQRSRSMNGVSQLRPDAKYDTVANRTLLKPTSQTDGCTEPAESVYTPHLVSGVFYKPNRGFIINSNGQVINLTNGDVLSIDSALRSNFISRVGNANTGTLTAEGASLGDAGLGGGGNTLPAINTMFNRVSVLFSMVVILSCEHFKSSEVCSFLSLVKVDLFLFAHSTSV